MSSRQLILYDLAKILQPTKDDVSPFSLILSTNKTSTYKLAKILVLILEQWINTPSVIGKTKHRQGKTVIDDLTKDDFQELLTNPISKSLFLFNIKYYQQVDKVAMGSLLRSTLANILLCYDD